jgi:hypothetical protein
MVGSGTPDMGSRAFGARRASSRGTSFSGPFPGRRSSSPAGTGDAIWSCVDVAREGGAIVTHDNEKPRVLTAFTVRTFLEAWLTSERLWDRLFREDGTRTIVNPLTRKPMKMKKPGVPIGVPWEPVG